MRTIQNIQNIQHESGLVANNSIGKIKCDLDYRFGFGFGFGFGLEVCIPWRPHQLKSHWVAA